MGEMDYIDHAIERDERQASKGKKKVRAPAPETKKRKKSVKDFRGNYGIDKSKGVMYLGHVPDGFMEAQMREYFQQYGDVFRIRLSRNRSTGNSRGYAFIEFESPAVAEIVAKTMNGYRMFKRTLQAKVMPTEKLHRRMWCGMGVSGRKHFDRKNFRKHTQNPANASKMTLQRFDSLCSKERKRNKVLAELGIDYKFESITKTSNATELRAKAKATRKEAAESVKAWKEEQAKHKEAHEAANTQRHSEAVKAKAVKKEEIKIATQKAREEEKKAKAAEREAAAQAKITKQRQLEETVKKDMVSNESVVKKVNKVKAEKAKDESSKSKKENAAVNMKKTKKDKKSKTKK